MHTDFMKRAIALSRENVEQSKGGPFGAVIVKDNTIIAEGANGVTALCDPTAHAEVMALRAACQKLKTFHLNGCIMYSSCEPCPMCLGALYWAHIDTIYFANSRADAAAIDFDDSFIYDEISLPIEKRSIKTVHLQNATARDVFDLWARTHKKIQY